MTPVRFFIKFTFQDCYVIDGNIFLSGVILYACAVRLWGGSYEIFVALFLTNTSAGDEGKALRETEITFERSRKRERVAFPRILNNKSGSAT